MNYQVSFTAKWPIACLVSSSVKRNLSIFSMHCLRECYVMVDEMEVAKKFKSAVNRTFNEKGGVFWKGLTDEQLATYIMQKIREFARTGGKKMKATLTIGRQPNKKFVDGDGHFLESVQEGAENYYDRKEDFDSAVYILNEKIQVNNQNHLFGIKLCDVHVAKTLRASVFLKTSKYPTDLLYLT